MSREGIVVVLLALVVATVSTVTYLWVVRKIVHRVLFPGSEPDPDDEMGVAVHNLQVALSEAITPPLERITRWLARHLS